ncbi:unnamed protein product [Protopolystoma xenopodis]|uniref:Uncharacterized protein n=1 Tax=Protopolystoma xenopodis TaxID=117903 RepID=A0A448WBX9_9PLAT|nr:unnamed protein product [Protopolystoma xenopodis]
MHHIRNAFSSITSCSRTRSSAFPTIYASLRASLTPELMAQIYRGALEVCFSNSSLVLSRGNCESNSQSISGHYTLSPSNLDWLRQLFAPASLPSFLVPCSHVFVNLCNASQVKRRRAELHDENVSEILSGHQTIVCPVCRSQPSTTAADDSRSECRPIGKRSYTSSFPEYCRFHLVNREQVCWSRASLLDGSHTRSHFSYKDDESSNKTLAPLERIYHHEEGQSHSTQEDLEPENAKGENDDEDEEDDEFDEYSDMIITSTLWPCDSNEVEFEDTKPLEQRHFRIPLSPTYTDEWRDFFIIKLNE